jgi:competence ComEA-like helix-hairpin-helix protein
VTAPRDWTDGPARWAAVAVLGLAGMAGLTYSLATHRARLYHPVRPRTFELPAVEQAPLRPSPAVGRIDVNTATAAELELLPGIGPALARRIVDDRAERGPFRTLDDLDRVHGIGPRTVERLRDLATTGRAEDEAADQPPD